MAGTHNRPAANTMGTCQAGKATTSSAIRRKDLRFASWYSRAPRGARCLAAAAVAIKGFGAADTACNLEGEDTHDS
jgi:hypothetical protein